MHPIILNMLAHRLIRPAKNDDFPIIDVFPETYRSIPDRLLSSICTYVSSASVTSNNRLIVHYRSYVPCGLTCLDAPKSSKTWFLGKSALSSNFWPIFATMLATKRLNWTDGFRPGTEVSVGSQDCMCLNNFMSIAYQVIYSEQIIHTANMRRGRRLDEWMIVRSSFTFL